MADSKVNTFVGWRPKAKPFSANELQIIPQASRIEATGYGVSVDPDEVVIDAGESKRSLFGSKEDLMRFFNSEPLGLRLFGDFLTNESDNDDGNLH